MHGQVRIFLPFIELNNRYIECVQGKRINAGKTPPKPFIPLCCC